MSPRKSGVRLDPVDHHHVVGSGEVAPHQDRSPEAGTPDFVHFHVGYDGRAHARLGDAQGGEHLALSLGGGAAVAAHGRRHEGLGPPLAHETGDFPDSHRHVAHSAAAGGDGHPLAGAHLAGDAQAIQSLAHRLSGIGESWGGNILTNQYDTRKRHWLFRSYRPQRSRGSVKSDYYPILYHISQSCHMAAGVFSRCGARLRPGGRGGSPRPPGWPDASYLSMPFMRSLGSRPSRSPARPGWPAGIDQSILRFSRWNSTGSPSLALLA